MDMEVSQYEDDAYEKGKRGEPLDECLKPFSGLIHTLAQKNISQYNLTDDMYGDLVQSGYLVIIEENQKGFPQDKGVEYDIQKAMETCIQEYMERVPHTENLIRGTTQRKREKYHHINEKIKALKDKIRNLKSELPQYEEFVGCLFVSRFESLYPGVSSSLSSNIIDSINGYTKIEEALEHVSFRRPYARVVAERERALRIPELDREIRKAQETLQRINQQVQSAQTMIEETLIKRTYTPERKITIIRNKLLSLLCPKEEEFSRLASKPSSRFVEDKPYSKDEPPSPQEIALLRERVRKAKNKKQMQESKKPLESFLEFLESRDNASSRQVIDKETIIHGVREIFQFYTHSGHLQELQEKKEKLLTSLPSFEAVMRYCFYTHRLKKHNTGLYFQLIQKSLEDTLQQFSSEEECRNSEDVRDQYEAFIERMNHADTLGRLNRTLIDLEKKKRALHNTSYSLLFSLPDSRLEGEENIPPTYPLASLLMMVLSLCRRILSEDEYKLLIGLYGISNENSESEKVKVILSGDIISRVREEWWRIASQLHISSQI